jgi:hypothetical protein
LIDQFQGRTYTLSGERISAYSFETDAAVRPLVRAAAEMQAAVESLERATALAKSRRFDDATREARLGVGLLEALTSRGGLPPDDEIVARRAMGDWFALSVELKLGDRFASTERAISEYEKAIRLLLAASGNPAFAGWKQELEARRRALGPAAQ